MKHLLILLIIGISIPVLAQPYVPQNIPKCEVTTAGCVYTLEQVKKLYKTDSRLTKEIATNKAKALQIKQLEKAIANLKKQVTLALENARTFNKRVGELTKLYIDTDKKYQECRVKPKYGSYIAWGTVVLISAGCTGYIIGSEVSR